MTVKEFNQCVDQYADGVYRFILKNIRDEEQARDVVQDAFEKMWKKSAGIEYGKSKSYLFTTAYHVMIDRLRKEKHFVTGSTTEQATDYNALHHFPDLKELLDEALNRLPEIQRSVILLRDYEGYPYEEIGEITGLNESQVKVYIYRARKSLKQYIGKVENVI